MIVAKKKNAETKGRPPPALGGGHSVRWVGGAVFAAALLLASLIAAAAWQSLRPSVLSHRDYQVDGASIQMTAPPPWIRPDFKACVLRDAGFESRLSVLNERLAERLAQAFALHPWVDKVNRVVVSYPAKIDIDLVYRRPVAMVEVIDGLLPIDADGVLLPSEDFTPLQASAYPRLGPISTQPLGPAGTRWGDATVSAGGKIADLLQGSWITLGLKRIRPSGTRQADGAILTPAFELETKGGTTVPWGNAPGSESPNEPTAAEKLARLKARVDKHGSLDDPD